MKRYDDYEMPHATYPPLPEPSEEANHLIESSSIVYAHYTHPYTGEEMQVPVPLTPQALHDLLDLFHYER
jgi:hypothetical protein